MSIFYFRKKAGQEAAKNGQNSLSSSMRAMGIWLGALGLFALATYGVAASKLPSFWTDISNGYAIGGYDPVDYFVRSKAVRPDKSVEAVWGGVGWRFSNIGNKQAFLAHPEIYAPRFGGVDPYLLARHRQVIGNPVLFDIYKDRLYLFHSGVTLLQWKQNRAAYVIHAAEAWPKVAVRLGLEAGISSDKSKPSGAGATGPLPDEK